MPETPYTIFCHHGYDLINRLWKFGTERLLPAMFEPRHDKRRADIKRDIAVISTYSRILDWLGSLERLNKTSDAQAIGAGARSIFELYLDLRWFEKFSESEWAERWAAYPEVDKFQAAQKAVNHAANTPHSGLDATPHQGFMDRLNLKEPVEILVKRVWGARPDGEPQWPGFHWTGQANLEKRAGLLGVTYQDAYRQIYPILSSLVHPGPTAYLRKTFDQVEFHVGYAYFYTFKHAHDATSLAANLLGIASRVEEFEASMQQLIDWLNDAMATLPPNQ